LKVNSENTNPGGRKIEEDDGDAAAAASSGSMQVVDMFAIRSFSVRT
jgi:hypothetical protein